MQSAAALLAGFAARTISPVEIIEAALAKIENDLRCNAWVHVAGEEARAAARASEARWAKGTPLGPLDGIPVGVKDLLAVTGQPMRRGSEAYPPDFTPPEDAPIVARLREAGAIIIGKTATPDSGCKLDTASRVHGTTRNPHNPALTAGGSSGGSAAALALGHVPVTIGTDGAGSIRIPAAYCGVFGMKPSTGRIPAPLGPFWPHAVTGPMTRTVLDTALVWNVASRPDARDPYALPAPNIDWIAAAKGGVAGLRIAVATAFHGIGASAEISETVRQAAGILERAGAIISAAEPDWPCDPLATFMVFWRCMYAQSVAMMPPEQASMIDPAIKHIISDSERISRALLQQAMVERDLLATSMARFHQDYDLLLCPVMPCQPWEAGRAIPQPHAEDEWSWCPFTYPFNMTRQPAASISMRIDAGGLPLAVQLIAAYGRDDLVFRGSFVLEGQKTSVPEEVKIWLPK